MTKEQEIKEMELTPNEKKLYEEMIETKENLPEEPEDFEIKEVKK